MKNVMLILVVCFVASLAQGATLFTEDWQTGTVDAGKWYQIGGSAGGFVYDIGGGDYVYYLSDSGTHQTALTSIASYDRADDLICQYTLWNDGNPLTYAGPGGPWWTTNTPGGSYPGLENFEAALGRMPGSGGVMAYVEGTSSMSGMPCPAQFNADFAAATSKATALVIRVALGTSTGAHAQWSSDGGATFTTIYDSRGMTAGTSYSGDNLVSFTDPVFLGFAGAGTYPTNARAIIDDIIVASGGVLNSPPSVDAGTIVNWPDYTNLTHNPDPYELDGTLVADDGVPVAATLTWSLQSGPAGGTATFLPNANVEDPNVVFNIDGVYELLLTADDTELTGSDTMIVYVRDEDFIFNVSDVNVSDNSLTYAGYDAAWMLTNPFHTDRDGVEDVQPMGWGWVAETADPNDEWIIVDLGNEFDLYRIDVWNYNWGGTYPNAGVRNMEILASNDETFATFESLQVITDLPQGPQDSTTPFGEEYTVSPTGGPYRYIKLDIESNWGHATAVGLAQMDFRGTGDDCAKLSAHMNPVVMMEMDFNNDCTVDLGDFAEFAAEWLTVHPDLP